MHIEVEHADGSTTALFGVSDFTIPAANTGPADAIKIGFPMSEAIELHGDVVRGVNESTVLEDMCENIADLACGENTTVVVGISDRYPIVKQAVDRLESQADFEGEIHRF
jgi:hypothetical protein